MIVDVVVGGRWHAPQVVGGLLRAGCSVRVITSMAGDWPSGCEVEVIPLRSLQRMAARLRLGEAAIAGLFGELAALRVRRGAVCLAWSSFAAGATRGRPTVVVRGSHHILRQRSILVRPGFAGIGQPSRASVALERAEYRRAVAVTVPTADIAADPLWKGDRARLVVSAYGFECGVGPGRDEQQGARSERVRGRLVSGGLVSWQKGFDRLAAAFEEPEGGVSDVVVGGARTRLRIPAWWSMAGLLPHDDWHELLATAEVFVLLSRQEGMARAGLEAVWEGTPIVVTEETGLGEVARLGAGIVVDGSPSKVRTAVTRILADWWTFHQSALAIARSWSWDDHVSQLIPILEAGIVS